MRCMYCLETADSAKGLAHVIPEAIAANGLTLPRGAVCDSCNSYLGHELDGVLSAHPVLALIIQFLRLPGKNDSVGKRLGNVASDIHPRGITIPCPASPERGCGAVQVRRWKNSRASDRGRNHGRASPGEEFGWYSLMQRRRPGWLTALDYPVWAPYGDSATLDLGRIRAGRWGHQAVP